jgi:ribosome-associated toxin RatA of RatAB toxin-antitoxin module
MRDLHGKASEVVSTPLESCVALLAAIDAYPEWYPDGVREVEVIERDAHGQPTRVRAVLHVEVAGFDRDFNLTMSVEAGPPGRVALTKVKADSSDPPFDVVWRVSEQAGTLIELDIETALPVPRLMPLGGVGDSIAKSFVSAASAALAEQGN